MRSRHRGGAHRGTGDRAGGRGRIATPAVLGAVAVLGLGGTLGSLAQWNDTATVEGGSLTSGTLDVTVDGGGGAVDQLTPWTAFAMTGVAPGESRARVLTVANAGTTPFTLAGTATAAGGAALVSAVEVRVVLGGTTTPDTTYPRQETCTGGTQTFAPATLGGTPKNVLAAGDAGTVQPGASVTLCLRAALPAGAGNATQGLSWTPTVVLTATQTPVP